MKNRQFNKKYMNVKSPFNRLIAELIPFVNRNIARLGYENFKMGNGYKYRYFGSILVMLSLPFGTNNSYAAMPTTNVYEPSQLGSEVWRDFLSFSERVNGSSLNQRPRAIRFNSIVYSGATWGMSSDGVAYGFILAPDVILVIEGRATLTAQSTSGQNGMYGAWVVDYSGKGLPTVIIESGSSNSNLIQVFTESPGEGDHYWGVGPSSDNLGNWASATPAFSGRSSVYLGPKAKGGLLTIPNTISMETVSGSQIKIIEAGTTMLIPEVLLDCTISSPPTLDFGHVNLWNFAGNSTGSPGGARKDVLGSIDGNLSISCSGDSPETTASAILTLTGEIQTYVTDLKVTMNSTGQPAPATIRSSIKNILAPCSSDGVRFAPASSSPNANKVNIDKLGVGQTNIPYRFSLCAFPDAGINQFGSASAQATITLDWD